MPSHLCDELQPILVNYRYRLERLDEFHGFLDLRDVVDAQLCRMHKGSSVRNGLAIRKEFPETMSVDTNPAVQTF